MGLLLLSMVMAASYARADDTAPAGTFQNPSHAPRVFGAEADAFSGPALKYVVMGDSTAAGQGAGYEKGIAVGTAQALAAGHRVTLVNIAVSGSRANDVVSAQLPLALGIAPDVVLLAVSANDVTHLTSVSDVQADVEKIIVALRAHAPCTAIVLTGAPDMGAPPRIPFGLHWLAGLRTASFNTMFRELAGRTHVTLAPLADETGPLFRKDRSLFADDGFHPNARGYATWIAVLNPALDAALRQRAACLKPPR